MSTGNADTCFVMSAFIHNKSNGLATAILWQTMWTKREEN